MPAALNNPESPAFYSLVSGIEIDETSSVEDIFVEAKNELINQVGGEGISEGKQPIKPPRQTDIVNDKQKNIEDKQSKQTNDKPNNELPILGLTNESKVASNEQTKQHSPPPGYSTFYPPISTGGQLPASCLISGTQGGIEGGYTPKATYYIDGNVGGPAIIISQGVLMKKQNNFFLNIRVKIGNSSISFFT
ncbi:hypothetical protein Mgra_00004108 [Meloidogyne graminicola]|uniref:Uncharacterized protein n=1 Tax=Meloidogyne graminicola TaxID=189291 RepID=A0A8S9ZS97_9BILA|nr:hypothetical protein Mgra_00004108 [Meloidogyne graminicola]